MIDTAKARAIDTDRIPAFPAEIRRALALLLEPGQVTELRALGATTSAYRRPHTEAGYFDDPEALAEAAAALSGRADGVYIIPNVVDPALLARASNRVRVAGDGDTTSDQNVMRRRWILFDCDADRPKGISATDVQHEAAIERARDIGAALTAEGWPAGILADSGNGGHRMYRIDLPADDDGLVRRVLEALAFRYSDDGIVIDRKVFNPARIWKLYGTLACKGDNTPERPHRIARILEAPDRIEVVSRAQLEALAATAPATADVLRGRQNGPGLTFDLDAFIGRTTAAGHALRGPLDWNGGRRWIFDVCPWNPDHANRSAFVLQFQSGAIAAGCHHNGCTGNDWHSLREMIDGPRPTRDWTPDVPDDGNRNGRNTAPESERLEPGRLPEPMRALALVETPEPADRWLAEGIIPADGNLLIGGYPKSGKTTFLLELAIALATGRPFLHWFRVPERRRVGLILMEDRAHRIARRLRRMCAGHGVAPEMLDGWAYFWFRPPLRLSDPDVMAELAGYVERLELDLLMVDSWTYVSAGDSDDADIVGPQLDALREACAIRPGCSPALTHHARKPPTGKGDNGERLTDMLRNSSHFGAWYDTGLVLARQNETSPIKLRAELRDMPAPEPAALLIEDQTPAGPDTGPVPSGWLRMRVADSAAAVLERRAAAERFIPAVLEVLRGNPGCSKRTLQDNVKGEDKLITLALELAVDGGLARIETSGKRGSAAKCYATAAECGGSAAAPHSGAGAAGAADHTYVVGGPPRRTPAYPPTESETSAAAPQSAAPHPASTLANGDA